MQAKDEEHSLDESLPVLLRDVVHELRGDATVPAEWRARVVAELSRTQVRHATWRRALPVAIAAGVCLIAGAIAFGVRDRDTIVAPSSRVNEPVRFTLVAPAARHVSLVGDFDEWSPRGVAMRRAADGHTWSVDVVLPPGRHAFAYMVDGILRADPAAAKAVEDDFGTPSSVIVVASRGME
jgi:hypothetical protein